MGISSRKSPIQVPTKMLILGRLWNVMSMRIYDLTAYQ